MKRYLTISIDVEPDCSTDWRYSNPLTFAGVHTGIGEILQPIFEHYQMVPTYLINNIVLENDHSVEFFNNLKGKFELGTHLHPEFIEPDKQFFDYAGQLDKRLCSCYPAEVERGKLKNITELFKRAFGYRPTAFRAGRFSAGPNTIASIEELGYKVDTSVTPHICWNGLTHERPLDFTRAPEQPYFIKQGSILDIEPHGEILQAPVSISLLKRNILKALLFSGAGLRSPIYRHRRVWLRPSFSSAAAMKKLVKHYTNKYADREVIVFNMMFHNIEVLPGLTPYAKTKKDCEQVIRRLEEFFTYCHSNNIQGIGLSDLFDKFRSNSFPQKIEKTVEIK